MTRRRRPRTPEAKQKISEGLRLFHAKNPGATAGLRSKNLGKRRSEETKRKLSEAHKGKPRSAESIAKANATKRANKSGRRACVAVEIDGVRYGSQTEAAQALGVTQANISAGLKAGRPGYRRLE